MLFSILHPRFARLTILAFIIYHLLHFTIRAQHPDTLDRGGDRA